MTGLVDDDEDVLVPRPSANLLIRDPGHCGPLRSLTMEQRPKGLTTLALLALIIGIFSFVAGLALMFGGTLGSAFGDATGGTITVLGAVMFGLAFASFLLGYGFWAMKPWARGAAIVVFTVSVAVNVATVIFLDANVLSIIVPVGVAIAAMWYISQPQTRAALTR